MPLAGCCRPAHPVRRDLQRQLGVREIDVDTSNVDTRTGTKESSRLGSVTDALPAGAAGFQDCLSQSPRRSHHFGPMQGSVNIIACKRKSSR
jgi:hypothetical protein